MKASHPNGIRCRMLGRSPTRSSCEDGELSSNRAIERFDPATGTWSTVIGDVGMESRHARAFEVDGKLCVLSLHHDGEPFADVLFIDVEAAAAASREM